jgi:uncharacterized protein YecE (DUF72 family)
MDTTIFTRIFDFAYEAVWFLIKMAILWWFLNLFIDFKALFRKKKAKRVQLLREGIHLRISYDDKPMRPLTKKERATVKMVRDHQGRFKHKAPPGPDEPYTEEELEAAQAEIEEALKKGTK